MYAWPGSWFRHKEDRLSAALEPMDWWAISSFLSDGQNCCRPHQRLKRMSLCVCVRAHVVRVLCTVCLPLPCYICVHVCMQVKSFSCPKKYGLRCISNAPMKSSVTADIIPAWIIHTEAQLDIFTHQKFFVFSYLRSILLSSMNYLTSIQ